MMSGVTSMKSLPSSSDWMIQVPLSELAALQSLPARMDGLEAENKQLRRELDGLRNMFSQVMQQFGDVKRQLKGR